MRGELEFEGKPPRFADWLMEPMRRNRPIYMRVALAAVFINIFALASSLFTMVVYDRVVPNNAVDSLIALSIGLAIVVIFDFILKLLRSYFTDIAGASIDREVGASVFQQLLKVRLDAKKGSTGALAGLMRELETLRDFFASATITALVDVPFILLTLSVIALIGGPVVFVPLAMVPLVILAGYLTHPALDRLSARNMGQGLLKQSVLVETIGGLETVKTTNAGYLLTNRWIGAIDEHASTSLRQRLIANLATTLAQSAQMISYAGVVIVGVGLIAERELSMGGLIACSILGGRAVAPLGQIASLLSRLSTTRAAYRQINGLMATPVEGPAGEAFKLGKARGEIEFRGVSFKYPDTADPALENVSFKIQPGEKVALLGRVGSGKSTIAKLILGLYPPAEGTVLLDSLDVRQIDPATLREKVGSSLQETVLLSGSVRDNIILGRPNVDDEEMLRAAQIAGTHSFMQHVTNGYDRRLADRGEGLSGGQRQSIALARALAGRPQILLLDEPSSQMDAQTEQQVLGALQKELAGRTLVVVTHRPPFLKLVDRIILMDRGKVIADGPRDEVMKLLQKQGAVPAAGTGAARPEAKPADRGLITSSIRAGDNRPGGAPPDGNKPGGNS
ncbi:type I secretion system permease/ATPase [Pacificimonas flava]|uniref:ABC transporter, transmembrane region:ABC transporter:Peptidase C39, bacteriocin processing n=1 Tax=Pacificimonas flava TaxID=1234595 RepID=M2U1W5_9SPHN|nr:type I secretion system permease/ATPase [Pacificimonas flava]EMD81977.1 ABC transporter, transmembrane region:ABC transporter:Peptidase C39, bacteriocin processing [Pacificimonas flava]MBB5280459.1 ATP-binding cassette subfamily C protein LapB [Pacificimonas flava]